MRFLGVSLHMTNMINRSLPNRAKSIIQVNCGDLGCCATRCWQGRCLGRVSQRRRCLLSWMRSFSTWTRRLRIWHCSALRRAACSMRESRCWLSRMLMISWSGSFDEIFGKFHSSYKVYYFKSKLSL